MTMSTSIDRAPWSIAPSSIVDRRSAIGDRARVEDRSRPMAREGRTTG